MRLKSNLSRQKSGVHPWTSAMSAIGGYARNAPEVAITLIANVLGNWGFNHGSHVVIWSTDMKGRWNPKKDVMWANCAAIRALDANVGNPTYSFGVALAGPMTEMALFETAVYSVAYPAAGIEVIIGGMAGGGMEVNRAAALHGQMASEVSTATAGLARNEANTLVNKIYPKYEHLLAAPPKGVPFEECYDPVKIKPKPDFVSLYNEVKAELGEMGVPFE